LLLGLLLAATAASAGTVNYGLSGTQEINPAVNSLIPISSPREFFGTVPEPGTLALFWLGHGWSAGVLRRKTNVPR
jgi:PEP-CTERM motif